MDILVTGGGIAGMSIAEILSQQGKSALLVEKIVKLHLRLANFFTNGSTHLIIFISKFYLIKNSIL